MATVEIDDRDSSTNAYSNLPESVTVLSYKAVDLLIVGTAHFSKPSQDDVIKVSILFKL